MITSILILTKVKGNKTWPAKTLETDPYTRFSTEDSTGWAFFKNSSPIKYKPVPGTFLNIVGAI